MGTVSRVHTFSSGAILTAAQLNNEFDNLLTSSAINGGLDATNLGVTAGQATASKALVVDGSRNLADGTAGNRINNLALSGTFESTGLITATAGITSGSNIVSDTDSTDDLGTTGVRWRNLYVDDVTVTNNVSIGGTLTLTGGLTLNGNVAIGDSASDTLTVNSTITSNLIFTDATYDIGASGATRPRDLHLSRNALMGGTLGVTGLLTATAGVTSGSNIVSDTDSTDDLGTTSVRWANLYVDSIGDTGQALAITAGSNNVNVTAGTLALTGAQTISSTLAVSDNVAVSKNGGADTELSIYNNSTSASAKASLKVGFDSANHLHIHRVGNAAGIVYNATQSGSSHQFQIAGSAKATLDATGLGIGTDSPSALIHASQGGEPPAEGMLILEANSSSRQLRIQPPTNADNGFFDARGGNMTFLDDGTEIWRYNASTFSTSAGINVGIGLSSPASGGTDTQNVHIHNSTSHSTYLKLSNNATGATASDGLDMIMGTSSDAYVFNRENGPIIFGTNATERMRLTSDGKVGIAVASPTSPLSIEGTGTTTLNSSSKWLSIGAGSAASYTANNIYGIGFGYTNSGNPESASFIGYKVTDGSASGKGRLVFATRDSTTGSDAPTERMTILSDGNLLVGGTSQSGTANRAAVFSANKFGLSIIDTTAQAAGVGGALNLGGNYRSAGDAQAFARVEAVKENATDANYAYGMAFSVTANGGTFAEKARILSSGGITFNGDTAAANALDDYEEGTFTPALGSGSASYSEQLGSYTKIGNVVFINVSLTWTGGPTSGNLVIGTLPFTSSSTLQSYSPLGQVATNSLTVSGYEIAGYIHTSSTTIQFANLTSGTGSTNKTYEAAGTIRITGHYFV